MTKIQKQRLLKLIEFLEDPVSWVGHRRFDLARQAAAGGGVTCTTVACAVGWTPDVFPELVRWSAQPYTGEFEFLLGQEVETRDYAEVAEYLFGIPRYMATQLFAPCGQIYVHDLLPVCGHDTSPAEFAKVLRKFLQLVQRGKISLIDRRPRDQDPA